MDFALPSPFFHFEWKQAKPLKLQIEINSESMWHLENWKCGIFDFWHGLYISNSFQCHKWQISGDVSDPILSAILQLWSLWDLRIPVNKQITDSEIFRIMRFSIQRFSNVNHGESQIAPILPSIITVYQNAFFLQLPPRLRWFKQNRLVFLRWSRKVHGHVPLDTLQTAGTKGLCGVPVAISHCLDVNRETAVLTFPRKAGNEWWCFKESTVSRRMATEETCLVCFLGFSLDGRNFWLTGRSINYSYYLLVPRQGWQLCLISCMSQATASAQS